MRLRLYFARAFRTIAHAARSSSGRGGTHSERGTRLHGNRGGCSDQYSARASSVVIFSSAVSNFISALVNTCEKISDPVPSPRKIFSRLPGAMEAVPSCFHCSSALKFPAERAAIASFARSVGTIAEKKSSSRSHIASPNFSRPGSMPQ